VNALVFVALGLTATLIAVQAAPARHSGAKASKSLEIRLTRPLGWENGCLQINFDVMNRSATTVFLPEMGLYIDSSAKLLSSDPEKNGSEQWLNVYGFSDVITGPVVEPLAPGAARRGGFCAPSTVDVVSLMDQMWRQIPVRGKLRITAQYYLFDLSRHTSRSTYLVVQRPAPRMSTLVVPIPCPKGGCAFGCEGPPLIVEGETQMFPDITPHDAEWLERGNQRDTQLRNLHPCSE
jgi:hypothetical protein